jgi:hypothetical protein
MVERHWLVIETLRLVDSRMVHTTTGQIFGRIDAALLPESPLSDTPEGNSGPVRAPGSIESIP